jgi:replicative DNA helicase
MTAGARLRIEMSKDTATKTSAPATITLFAAKEKAHGTRKTIKSWHKLFTAFAQAKAPRSAEKLDQPGWSPAVYTDDVRRKPNVEQVYAVVLDYDAGTTSPEQALDVWQRCLACTYTSWSHTLEKPKFRLILPMSRSVSGDEYARVWTTVVKKVRAAGHVIDEGCKDASRLWFLPCRRDDSFGVIVQDGDVLDADAIPAESESESDHGPIEPFEAFEANGAYGNAALRRECEAVAEAAQGKRNSQLNKASFSIGQLVAGGVLDEAEATRSLLNAACACGLSGEEAERTIHSGMSAGKQQPRTRQSSNDTTDDAPWDEPQTLSEDVELPPLPWAACLPPWLWQWVQSEAIATQTPEDLAALLALSVLATCSQRRWRVRIKDGWSEPLCIYVAVVLAPGNRKSAVFRAASDPLYEWEAAQRIAIEAELAAAATTAAIAEKKLRAAEARAGKDGDPSAIDDAMTAARELADAQAEVPTIPRLVTSDATQEAVARLLNEQHGAISVMDAEGCGPVALMLGRYSDGAAAVDVYLRGHAGDALRVDRVGRDPIIVDHPRISMGITVQPAVVEQLGERRELRGLGLLARILWCQPQSTVGKRDVDPPSVPSELVARYHQAIHALLGRDALADGELSDVAVSREAWMKLRSFMEELEPRLAESGDLAPIADWASKLAGAVARVAGLLHIATHGGPGHRAITADTMTAAVVIGRYLLAHARKVLGQMGASDPVLVDAKAMLSHLRQRKVTAISRRDLHQALRKGYEGRFRRAEDLDAPLSMLVERGWVRLREQRDGDNKGRPSVIVRVNPRELGWPQKPQKAQKVEREQSEAEVMKAIEPIEANRVIELTCTMTANAEFGPSATTTRAPVIIHDVFTGKPFDVSTPEGEEVYREHLLSMV